MITLSPVPDGVTVVASVEKAEQMAEKKKAPPLIILESLQAYLEEIGFGTGELMWGRLGSQGSSGTFHIALDENVHYALKRRLDGPQPSDVMSLADEIKLLEVLRGHHLHAPDVLHVCNDASIIGAPFYLSAFLPGERVVNSIPDALNNVEEKVGMSRRAIDDLARIQVEVTPSEIAALDHGGSDLRKLVLESKRLGRKLKMRRLPGFEILGDYLLENAPEPYPSVLSHGRYSMQNLLFLDKAPATISGVFGWERATACDPLMDLGYFTATYSARDLPETPLDTAPVTRDEDGFLSRNELVNVFRIATHLDTANLPWFQTFCLWREAVRLEEIYERLMNKEAVPSKSFALSLRDGVPAILANAAHFSKVDGVEATAPKR
jgi:aminoglycoside phosphotransferase (APT) family kinase protein